MGIVALASLAVTTAATIGQARQASRANRARREASAVRTASEEIRNRAARRRAAREERIRRARLLSGATQAGVSDTSGLVGAQSALGASFGQATALQESQTQAAIGITRANQRAANAISAGRTIGAFGELAGAGLSLFEGSRFDRPVFPEDE